MKKLVIALFTLASFCFTNVVAQDDPSENGNEQASAKGDKTSAGEAVSWTGHTIKEEGINNTAWILTSLN